VGNQVLVVDSEDALQISIHKLETLTSKYGLNISKSNIKSMALKGRDPVRSKTVINNNVIEERNTSFITWVALLHTRMKNILLLKYHNLCR